MVVQKESRAAHEVCLVKHPNPFVLSIVLPKDSNLRTKGGRIKFVETTRTKHNPENVHHASTEQNKLADMMFDIEYQNTGFCPISRVVFNSQEVIITAADFQVSEIETQILSAIKKFL